MKKLDDDFKANLRFHRIGIHYILGSRAFCAQLIKVWYSVEKREIEAQISLRSKQ